MRLLGVPFDATTSYRKGAARGPEAILAASHQVDLFDPLQGSWPGGDGRPWAAGLSLEIDSQIGAWNTEATPIAQRIIDLGGVLAGDAELSRGLERVNELGDAVNDRVRSWTGGALDEGAQVGIVGGDHASPFGAIQAAAARCPGLGLLHMDAHADLREAYEGFTWSHASILHNVLERLPGVAEVLSVGVRDLGEREAARLADEEERVRAVMDHEWSAWRLAGEDLGQRARGFIDGLPDCVWVSFDVDGLDPALCPSTGTPVPGGLRWDEAMLWLDTLANSGKRVVGFDLCEVSPGEDSSLGTDTWDAIVGARLLYRLIGLSRACRG